MAVCRQVLVGFAANLFDISGESENSDDEQLSRVPFSIQEIPERVLYQRTRLDRKVFNYVLEVISPALVKNSRKGRYAHLTPMHKLYVALQFYATGSVQWLLGSSGQISQSAASHAITEVTEALVAVSPQFIRFPTTEEYLAVKHGFYTLGMVHHGIGFPNVLGAIDCTHVKLHAPTNAPEQYLNRHNYYSINVQLVVGPDLKIFNTFAEYPGSNHDSVIWKNAAIHDALAAGHFTEGWLVGDLGYPQEPWLMTPAVNATTAPELLYNSVHSATRNPVEAANSMLKSRWHVLISSLSYTPAKVCSIATACCVLHNICTQYDLEVEDLVDHPLNDELPHQGSLNLDYDQLRRDLIAQHFTQ